MTQLLTPEQTQELAAFPPALRELIDAELAAGNTIVEIGHSFPAPPVGAYVRFELKVTTRPHESDNRLSWRARYSATTSGEWTDDKRLYFVVEPPGEPPEEVDMETLRDLPAPPPPLPPLSAIPIPIAARSHQQPPRSTAFSGPVVIKELPTGVTFEVSIRDARTPVEARALLEKVLVVPFVLDAAGGCLRAVASISGADYQFELRFLSASPHTNNYALSITGTWAKFSAERHDYFRKRAGSWFSFWTRAWPPARWGKALKNVPALYQQRLQRVIEEDLRFESIEAIQSDIIAGLKNGGWYSASDKEGSTRISWNGRAFIRYGEGDHESHAPITDEALFLNALRQFCSWDLNREPREAPLTERETWILVLRQMEKPM